MVLRWLDGPGWRLRLVPCVPSINDVDVRPSVAAQWLSSCDIQERPKNLAISCAMPEHSVRVCLKIRRLSQTSFLPKF